MIRLARNIWEIWSIILRELEKAINSIKKEFGKNSILKGINFVEGATTRKRNKLIGGHRSGEED